MLACTEKTDRGQLASYLGTDPQTKHAHKRIHHTPLEGRAQELAMLFSLVNA
jgi:hypothetical protein